MNKRTIIYLILVFGLSIPLYILISRSGGLEGPGEQYVLLLMWCPGIAALITTLIFQRNLRGLGWGLGRPRYLVIGYLLPILYAGIVYGAIWLSGLGGVDFSRLGAQPVSTLVFVLTVNVLISILLALGEEIGWRGLLAPQLYTQHTFVGTALISGLIWGVWHIPLIITGDYSSGAPTWYAITCFMIHITGLAFAFAWLRLASGSLWPAALMHATHNAFIQSVLDKITVDSGRTAYFSTEFGLGLAMMGVIVALCFWWIGLPISSRATDAQSFTTHAAPAKG
ncbi:MAG: CPBP family intramembrane metalloprotease [Caldilineaceae bacterium]|nr:CPBP family intramembrane metalloprotease [Caldilineaceae bacterium]